MGPDLAFRLHRQRVVELALRGDAEGAMAHAAETLAPAAAADSSGAKLAEMEGAVALAAFDAPAEVRRVRHSHAHLHPFAALAGRRAGG